MRKALLWIVGLGMVPLAIAMIAHVLGYKPPPPTAEEIAKEQESSAAAWAEYQRIYVKANVVARLKDPGSAMFGRVFVRQPTKFDPKATGTVCGSVNSKNSFGGYTGMQDFVAYNNRLYFEPAVAFYTYWNRYCVKGSFL